jgi:hypothetical protein
MLSTPRRGSPTLRSGDSGLLPASFTLQGEREKHPGVGVSA